MNLVTPDNAAAYLQARGWLPPGTFPVDALGWGVSNAVLRVHGPDGPLIVKQARPQLRTREAWFSDVDRALAEAAVMQTLEPLLPPGTVPRVLHLDRADYVFAMTAAPDHSAVWKERLLKSPVGAGPVARRAGLILGLIHELTARRPDLAQAHGDRRIFEQLRVEPFYERVRGRRPEVAGPLDDLIGELRTLRLGLCHGDFSPKNLLIHPPPAAGPFTLVDYETAHYGDPAMDLGFFLSHLILKGLKNLPQRAGYFLLTRVFWKAYEAVIRFQPVEAIKPRAIRHFAACALARVDGASPVDYLPGPAHQDAVRQFAGRLLQHPVRRWREALHAVETACQPLEE